MSALCHVALPLFCTEAKKKEENTEEILVRAVYRIMKRNITSFTLCFYFYCSSNIIVLTFCPHLTAQIDGQ